MRLNELAQVKWRENHATPYLNKREPACLAEIIQISCRDSQMLSGLLSTQQRRTVAINRGCVDLHAIAGMSNSPMFCHRIWRSLPILMRPRPRRRNCSVSVGAACSVIVISISGPYYDCQNCRPSQTPMATSIWRCFPSLLNFVSNMMAVAFPSGKNGCTSRPDLKFSRTPTVDVIGHGSLGAGRERLAGASTNAWSLLRQK